MQLISKFNKEFRFLLCVIDIFNEYAWVVPLKDKKKMWKLLMRFKKFWKNLVDENQAKHGLIMEVNFAAVLLNNC